MEASSVKETLKVKWKEHCQKRSFMISHKQANYVGVCYSLYSIFYGYYYVMFRLIPLVYSGRSDFGVLWSRLFATFLLFEVFANWMQCARKYLNAVRDQNKRGDGSSGGGGSGGGGGDSNFGAGDAVGRGGPPPAAGWRHCPICQLPAPPRSHHCKLCQACMLKRDHHCFFTGGCIGFYTQRNFLYFTMWTLVAHAYVFYLVANAYEDLPLPPVASLPAYFIALTPFYWLLGLVTGSEALAVVHIYLAFIMIAAASFYAFVEILLVTRNQTLWELGKGITKYDAGFFANVRSSLGSYWLVGLLVPWLPAIPGDGYAFPLGKQMKAS